MKLIILACSATKRVNVDAMPAIDRYDGPMWRTLRARLDELERAKRAIRDGTLAIKALSARYGLIDAYTSIQNYELALTLGRSQKMLKDPSCDLQLLPHMIAEAETVLFAGGEFYRDLMWKAAGGPLQHIMKIDETDGPGIGAQRRQLSRWLIEHYYSEGAA